METHIQHPLIATNTRRLFLTLVVQLLIYITLVNSSPARVLIFSRTAKFRHDSIPTAIKALKLHASTNNLIFDQTEDQAQFTDETLQDFDGVLFLSNTGEVLDDAGKQALQNYLNKGGNIIGIHSASDCLRTTPFYGKAVGAYFDYHANLQNATVDVIVRDHASTVQLPLEWHVMDEMYNFMSDPRSLGAVVVLAANESSYIDTGTRNFDQGSPHPLAWCQEREAGRNGIGLTGRSFYTSLGHLNETWQDDLFMSHVLGGINWVLQSNTTLAFNAQGLVGNKDDTGLSSTPAPSAPKASPSGPMAPQDSGTTKRFQALTRWLVDVGVIVIGLYI